MVKNNNQNTPPLTHNLLKLSEESKINLTKEEKNLLFEFNRFNIEARYPDSKFEFYKLCTKDFVKIKLEQIKEIYTCILKQI